MALEQRLTARLQQRLVMTPALQLAIKLLQLNKLELEATLQQEMVENPVLEELEELEEPSVAERAEAEAAAEVADTAPAGTEELGDNFDADEFFSKMFDYQPTTANMYEQGEAPPFENTLTALPSLVDHLLWQLEGTALAPGQRPICQAILGNLDESGYLRASCQEIADMGSWSELEVQRVLATVQELDPRGVAARDLRECLYLQLEHLGAERQLPGVIVRDHMEALTAHRFKEIARATHARVDEISDAVDIIRTLNPKPGQEFTSESPRYIVPDVYVRKDGDEYVATVNDDGLPKLRVSRLYRDMLRSDNGLSKQASEYLQEKMRSALWLIKSYGQRQRTIGKVAASILEYQRDFFDHGLVALRPMVLRDVAEDIGMHESTVSRVVNGKYMHTPQGLFEMRFFFHSGLGHASGSEVSSVSVKDKIRKLIESEEARKPMSDAAIANRLREGGLLIARRTVAKYREEMRIPASRARRAIG
ncbi:MAG TPA: RNA polymerase factor sigma-54 [Acidobacteriota bacterium]|nr:RNA polymerase factor sigma-54 [Acidobacteriota bacterium]